MDVIFDGGKIDRVEEAGNGQKRFTWAWLRG